jgi:cytoskeleton protein RodZ
MSEPEAAPLRADPQGLGPGEALTQAREEHDIPVEEMARRLHLSVATVRALEECDRVGLPENAYVLGYVRAYVRMLDLDPEPYVSAYKAWLGEGTPGTRTVAMQGPDTEHGSRSWAGWVLAAVLAAFVAAAALWWLQTGTLRLASSGAPPGADGGDEPAGVDQGRSVASVAGGGVTPASLPGDRVLDGGGSPESPSPSPDEAASRGTGRTVKPEIGSGTKPGAGHAEDAIPRPAKTPEVAQDTHATAVPAMSQGHRLILRFNSQSWTEVYDSEGKRLLFDLYKPGQVKAVEGKPPFRIRLGYADGVELTYNGKPVDMSRHVRPDKTARFVLAADEEAEGGP